MEKATHNDKLSVIIPAYNAQHRVKQCINSVLKALREEDELILVNDGSKDSTSDIVRGIPDCRIHLIEQKNSGVSAARNTGLNYATGSLIAFVDADDTVLPDIFESLRSNLTPRVDLVITGYQMVDHRGHKLYSNKDTIENLTKKRITSSELAKDYFAYFYAGVINSCCGKLYRRSILEHTRFDAELKMGEDASFNLEVFNNCRKIEIIANDSYLYFQDENQSSRKYNSELSKMLCRHFFDIDSFINKYSGYDNTYVCEGMGRCWGNTICDYLYDYCGKSEVQSEIGEMLKMPWSKYLDSVRGISFVKRCVLWALLHHHIGLAHYSISAIKRLRSRGC